MYYCVLLHIVVMGLLLGGPSVVSSSSSVVSAQECPEGVEGISCLGSTIAQSVAKHVLGESSTSSSSTTGDSRQLWDGVQLVHLTNSTQHEGAASSDEEQQAGRDLSTSFLQGLRKLVASYEIRVRLSELLNGAINEVNDAEGRKGGGFGGGGFGGGDKVGKKGGGALMMMMMMGGMMKMMAMGALGMLAMKALTVSSLAFMLSVIVGLKKLLSKKDDDDGGHYVKVVGGGEHGGGGGGDYHRRSMLLQEAQQLAYRGQQRRK